MSNEHPPPVIMDSEVDDGPRVPHVPDPRLSENVAFQRDDRWQGTKTWIKIIAAWFFAGMGLTAALLAFLLAAYFVLLMVIHYTVPASGWLTAEQLSTLESRYTTIAGVVFPTMLITNAWVIWWFSRRKSDD